MVVWTDEELRQLSLDVLYDIQVLFGAARRLEQFVTILYTDDISDEEAVEEGLALPWLEHVTLVEAFAVHARALVEFLFRDRAPKVRATDLLAADYFRPGKWRALCPPQEATLDPVRRRV